MPTKEIIECTFEQGRIHGEGSYTDAKGNRVAANWNYDLMIPEADQDVDCTDKLPLNLFFVCAFWGLLAAGIYF
jgi:hypothetical protein